MSFRLYESVWVVIEGADAPCQAHKDPSNMAVFIANGHRYDVDARPISRDGTTPAILSILSLQAMREAGLRSDYNQDVEVSAKTSRRQVRPGQ